MGEQPWCIFLFISKNNRWGKVYILVHHEGLSCMVRWAGPYCFQFGPDYIELHGIRTRWLTKDSRRHEPFVKPLLTGVSVYRVALCNQGLGHTHLICHSKIPWYPKLWFQSENALAPQCDNLMDCPRDRWALSVGIILERQLTYSDWVYAYFSFTLQVTSPMLYQPVVWRWRQGSTSLKQKWGNR
jgi:hypothetical protein